MQALHQGQGRPPPGATLPGGGRLAQTPRSAAGTNELRVYDPQGSGGRWSERQELAERLLGALSGVPSLSNAHVEEEEAGSSSIDRDTCAVPLDSITRCKLPVMRTFIRNL
jgi:hypothetical protein